MKATTNQPSLHQLGAVLGELQVRCDATALRTYHLAARIRSGLPDAQAGPARAALGQLRLDGAMLNAAREAWELEFRARAVTAEASNDSFAADPMGAA